MIFTERDGATFRQPTWYSLKPEEMQHIRERIVGVAAGPYSLGGMSRDFPVQVCFRQGGAVQRL